MQMPTDFWKPEGGCLCDLASADADSAVAAAAAAAATGCQRSCHRRCPRPALPHPLPGGTAVPQVRAMPELSGAGARAMQLGLKVGGFRCCMDGFQSKLMETWQHSNCSLRGLFVIKVSTQ